MSKSSISFRVPKVLWGKFKQQTDALFLSRAPFLDHVLQLELQHLTDDLQGVKLSSRTKRYIANTLLRTDKAPLSVNIEVSSKTADFLKEVIAKHNLVRDAFISRLIIFLRSEKAILDELEVPHQWTNLGKWGEAGLPPMPTSPLKALAEVVDDPLYNLREYVRHRWNQGLYAIDLPENFDWIACQLSADRVKDSPAYKKSQKQREELVRYMQKYFPATSRKTQKENS